MQCAPSISSGRTKFLFKIVNITYFLFTDHCKHLFSNLVFKLYFQNDNIKDDNNKYFKNNVTADI